MTAGLALAVRDFHASDPSAIERLTQAHAAVRFFTESPVTGIGLGTFVSSAQSVIPGRDSYVFQPVHSVPLLVLSEVGLFGLMLSIVTVTVMVKAVKWSVNALAVLVGIAVISAMDHYLMTLHQAMVIGTVSYSILYRCVRASTRAGHHMVQSRPSRI
jgi:O-antigen ligase